MISYTIVYSWQTNWNIYCGLPVCQRWSLPFYRIIFCWSSFVYIFVDSNMDFVVNFICVGYSGWIVHNVIIMIIVSMTHDTELFQSMCWVQLTIWILLQIKMFFLKWISCKIKKIVRIINFNPNLFYFQLDLLTSLVRIMVNLDEKCLKVNFSITNKLIFNSIQFLIKSR